MKKIFVLCALLVALFTSVCSAEPVSNYWIRVNGYGSVLRTIRVLFLIILP